MNNVFDILIKPRTFWKLKVQPAIVIWFIFAIRAVVLELSHGEKNLNNFLIYKYVFFHTIHQQNLYLEYPSQYLDSNHYGPLFSIIILPFAILPIYAGYFFWGLLSSLFLFFAIEQLNFKKEYKMLILLIGIIELQRSIHESQFNPITAGLIILSFTLIEKRNIFWAAFFIMTGFLVKLYGIVGICFICFSKDKLKLIYSLFFWFLVLYCLPMVISSPKFIVQSYSDWFEALVHKNALNSDILDLDFFQDISVMGFIRRLFGFTNFPNMYVLMPALIFYIIPFFRKDQHRYYSFRLSFLALSLIGVVIFSSSAESSTYIIASIGVGIWFILESNKKNFLAITLLIFTFIVSSLFTNYVFPKIWVDQYFYRYSIKVVPYFFIWCILAIQLLRKDYSKADKNLF